MNDSLLSICVAAIITSVFRMLVPDERAGKQIRLIISCFFIVTVVNLLGNFDGFDSVKEIFEIETNYNDYTVVYEKQTADETANALRKRIYSELEKEKIYPEKIYIDINISENDSISISKIRLVFTDKNSHSAERAVKITTECTGNEIEVVTEEW